MNNIMKLIDQVGSNAYAAKDLENGSAEVEMTAARANKLSELLGAENVSFVAFRASHVIVGVDIEVLAKAAESNKRTSRGSSINVSITSRIQYAVEHGEHVNDVTEAFWGRDEMIGNITVNGTDYEVFPGLAKDYYDIDPNDSEAQPERTVYVVALPTDDGDLVLSSYGMTNLIRRVASRNEVIG